VAATVNRLLEAGRDVVVYTSRALVRGSDPAHSLHLGSRVSQGLIDVVRRLTVQPRYLVAKGGITSSDVATQGLGVQRAAVAGQILPGVPVWVLGEESRFPGAAYVFFREMSETKIRSLWFLKRCVWRKDLFEVFPC
jgi:uncharacterized protein YgbK (DUF1537 family)